MIPAKHVPPPGRTLHRAYQVARLILPCLLAAGCSTASTPGATTNSTAAGQLAATSPVDQRAPEKTTADSQPELVLWTVPELGPDAPEGAALAEAIAAFSAAHRPLQVRVALKPAQGPGDIRTFLESTARVVPGALPDVAVLPIASLRAVAAEGLLQPIPPAVPSDRIDDAFAFARDRCRYEIQPDVAAAEAEAEAAADVSQWLAVPFAVDVIHAVGREAGPPTAWADVLAGVTFGIPAGGASLAELAPVLALYGASGGDVAALPAVDGPAVATTFGFLARGAASGSLAAAVGGTTLGDAWSTFLDAELDVAAVSGGVFASQQANYPGLRWGSLPGPEGPAPAIGWGWAFVVTSPSADRAALAGQLIAWLTAPERRGWVVAAHYFPAWQTDWAATTAAALAPRAAAEYLDFLGHQLTSATSAEQPEVWAPTWGRAVGDVLGGGAADDAIATIVP